MLDTLLEKANRLPLLPGVYIMLDAHGEVIYVGKAKKLKNRVSSYFHGEHLPKVAAMVEKVADFNVIVAASEFEALVLENSLIKRHKPHYNILLKDDKGYPFIRVDMREEYPVMTIASRAAKDGARYFGPFGGPKPDPGDHQHHLQGPAAAGLLPEVPPGYRQGAALPELSHGLLRRLVPAGRQRRGLSPADDPGGADPGRQKRRACGSDPGEHGTGRRGAAL